MSEQEQGTTAQAEETAQDQESTEETQQQGQEPTEQKQETTPKTYDEDYVKGLRTESANYRTERNEVRKERDALKARVEELESGQDAGSQSLRSENETLKSEVEQLRRDKQRSLFIESINLPNPRAAWGYVLDGTVEVEYDENHRPQKLDDVRKRLREEDPGLFGEGSADGGATSRTNGYQGAPGVGRLRHAYEQKTR